MNKCLDIQPEIKAALDAGKPVVALESTILSHGMPYPENVEFAHKVEEIVRGEGAVPACAITAPCRPPWPSSAAS